MDLTGAVVEELLQFFDPLACASGDEATTLLTELRHPRLLQLFAADIATGALAEVVSITLLEGEGVDLIEDEDRRLIVASVDLTQRRGDDLDMLLEVRVSDVHHV